MLNPHMYDDLIDAFFFNDFERICKKVKEEIDSNKEGRYSNILKKYFPQLDSNKKSIIEKLMKKQNRQSSKEIN